MMAAGGPVAKKIADHYGLKPGMRVLDVGCGKGYLLFEFTQVVPGIEVAGLEISEYAIQHAKAEVREAIRQGNATELPFEDDASDLVVSLGCLHNLANYDLDRAAREIERVGNGPKYIMVESFRTEAEKANLLYWQIDLPGISFAGRMGMAAGLGGLYRRLRLHLFRIECRSRLRQINVRCSAALARESGTVPRSDRGC